MAEQYKKKDGHLVNNRGEWVWNKESYQYVIDHSSWLPLVFKSKADADEFELLEKIWKAEQIVKTSHNKQEVMLAKAWLREHGVKHSDMGNVVYYINEDSDFLMHHGIKGQKWGVENGPPYPLDSSVSTGKRLKIEEKANKVKAEQDVRHQVALNFIGSSANSASNWKEGIRTKKALDDAMFGIEASKYAIQKYKDGIKKYPKKAEDFNEYIEQVRKNTDELTVMLDKMKAHIDVDPETEKKYNEYIKKLDNANKTSWAVSAVGDTLGIIGGLYLGGPAGAFIGGTAVGIATKSATQAAMEQKATKELQAYLDKMNK